MLSTDFPENANLCREVISAWPIMSTGVTLSEAQIELLVDWAYPEEQLDEEEEEHEEEEEEEDDAVGDLETL